MWPYYTSTRVCRQAQVSCGKPSIPRITWSPTLMAAFHCLSFANLETLLTGS